MGHPSSSPSAADEPFESDRAPLMELIHRYRIEQAMLVAHQQEVERRREAVRTAAEVEASAILAAARREIRRVLVRTRHELVALTAQVQAAGCEAPPSQPAPEAVGDQFQLSAAREVRGVLRDARTELNTLSRDATNFWPSENEARLPAPAVAMVPLLDLDAAHDFSSTSTPRDNVGDIGENRGESLATNLAERLLAHWRIGAVALVILALVVTAIVTRSPASRTDPAATTPRPESAGSAATPQAPAVPAAAATPPTVQPATTQPSRARPPEPTPATGATRGTTGQQTPASVPVAPRSAAQPQTAPQPNRAAPAAQDVAVAEREILERHQRWFEAFEHGDRAAMASIASDNFSIVDERPERATASGRVAHTTQDVRVRVTAGVGAVLSGRIAGTTAANDTTVAMLSEVWIRQAEQWRLVSVRMVPLAAVASTLQ